MSVADWGVSAAKLRRRGLVEAGGCLPCGCGGRGGSAVQRQEFWLVTYRTSHCKKVVHMFCMVQASTHTGQLRLCSNLLNTMLDA